MRTIRTSNSPRRSRLCGEILESRRVLSIDMPDLAAYEMQRWLDHVVSLPPDQFTQVVEGGHESLVVVPDVVPTPPAEPLIEFDRPATPKQEAIWAEVIPRFVDEQQRPIESIEVGETAWVEVVIDDTRKFSQRGVFSAFFDIDFGDAKVTLAGEAVFSQQYKFLRRTPSVVGWNGIGAVDTKWFTPDPDPHRLVRIPVRFESAGEATVQLGPHHVETLLLYGYDQVVSVDRIDFGRATINVLTDGNDSPAKFQPTNASGLSTGSQLSGFVTTAAANDPPIEVMAPVEGGTVLTVAVAEPLSLSPEPLGDTTPRAFVVQSKAMSEDESEEERRHDLQLLEALDQATSL